MGAAQLQQLLRRQAPPGVVVRSHTGDAGAQAAVDADEGEAFHRFQLIIGQGNDAVRLVLADHTYALPLRVGLGGGDIEEHSVIPLEQRRADVLGQEGEKGVIHAGQNQGCRGGGPGPEAPGVLVHLVAQLLGGGLHLDPVALAHGDPVEYLGHGAQGHSGLLGHVLHSRHSFFHRSLPRFGVKHFIFCAKNGRGVFVEPIIADKAMKCKE